MAEPPCDTLKGSLSGGPDHVAREFAVQWHNLPSELAGTAVSFDPTYNAFAGGNPNRLGKKVAGLETMTVSLPAQRTLTVRVRVAAGTWRTACETERGNTSMDTLTGAFAFSPIHETDSGVAMTVAHSIVGPESRVVAVGLDGREHRATDQSGGGAGNFVQMTATFSKLSLKEIKVFRVQTRPYQWVEFRNVSLHSGQKTDVQIVHPDAPLAAAAKPGELAKVNPKPEKKPGQSAVAPSGKATDQGGGKFHLVRGNTAWIGSDGAPLMYDDYDKNCYAIWGAHTVVLPKHAEGFWDFYSQRTLDPGIGRMDVSRDDWKSGEPANVVKPGAIDLPTYQLLLQPSVQHVLNLSEQQRTKLQDISAKYWPERRQIAGKELADTESASQRKLAVECAKAHHGIVWSSTVGGSSPFSKEVVEKLERQWSGTRKQIEDVLTPEQLRTLKDLTFRTFALGSGVMFEPDVLGRLGAAANQQDKLRALEPELQKEKDRRLRSMTREKIKKMLAVLTPVQQSQLREKQSPDKNPDTDCSMYPYPGLPGILPDSGAAEELGFSTEQRERVRKIVTAHWMTLIALQQEEQKLPLENEKAFKAIGEKRRQEMAGLRKQIEAALTPRQWALCKEMAFENLAVLTLRRAAHDAEVSLGMGLSEQQRTALRAIEAEYFDKPEQIYRELTDKALAAFTPAQREKLRAEVDRRGW